MLYTHVICLQVVYVIAHIWCGGPWLGHDSMCMSMRRDSHTIRTCECTLRQRLLYLLNRTCEQYTMEYNAFHIITKACYNRSNVYIQRHEGIWYDSCRTGIDRMPIRWDIEEYRRMCLYDTMCPTMRCVYTLICTYRVNNAGARFRYIHNSRRARIWIVTAFRLFGTCAGYARTLCHIRFETTFAGTSER